MVWESCSAPRVGVLVLGISPTVVFYVALSAGEQRASTIWVNLLRTKKFKSYIQ